MPFAEQFLKQAHFSDVASNITVGTIGPNHAKVPRKLIIGPDDGKSLAVGGKPFMEKGGERENGGGKICPPKTEHPLHTPSIVRGNRGRVRTKIKGNSTGLQFEHIEMDDASIPFEYNPETGCLSFNVRHSNWSLCQEKDEFLRDYHLAVVIIALTNELFKGQDGISPEVRKYSFDSLTNLVFGIRNGKAFMATQNSGRKNRKH
jgi:hypothetical protein